MCVRSTAASVSAARWSARTDVLRFREKSSAPRSATSARILDPGIPMLSQPVLLRGVNDDAATLGALMRTLVESRVKPYYLHHGDLAPGTAHLRSDIGVGRDLMHALRGRHSGLCQPTYV